MTARYGEVPVSRMTRRVYAFVFALACRRPRVESVIMETTCHERPNAPEGLRSAVASEGLARFVAPPARLRLEGMGYSASLAGKGAAKISTGWATIAAVGAGPGWHGIAAVPCARLEGVGKWKLGDEAKKGATRGEVLPSRPAPERCLRR